MFVNLFKRDTESVVAGELLLACTDTAGTSEDGQYSDDGDDGDCGDDGDGENGNGEYSGDQIC